MRKNKEEKLLKERKKVSTPRNQDQCSDSSRKPVEDLGENAEDEGETPS